MTEFILKYNLLDSSSKQEIMNFMDFLLTKKRKSKKIKLSDYKKNILNVSVWNDSEIELIIKNQQTFNQWKVQNW